MTTTLKPSILLSFQQSALVSFQRKMSGNSVFVRMRANVCVFVCNLVTAPACSLATVYTQERSAAKATVLAGKLFLKPVIILLAHT